jgi:hypothetical protein
MAAADQPSGGRNAGERAQGHGESIDSAADAHADTINLARYTGGEDFGLEVHTGSDRHRGVFLEGVGKP